MRKVTDTHIEKGKGLRHRFAQLISPFLIFFISPLLLSCEGENQYNTQYPCSFVFHAQYHITSRLTLCLNNPGEFVIVSTQLRKGVTHLIVSPNNGQEDEDIPLTTAIENERTNYQNMGAGGSLIIGFATVGELRAYDRQCPNCLQEFGGHNYPLTWADRGLHVSCSRCHRIYDLNGFIPVCTNGQEGDRPLLQYKPSYDGQRLYVHN
jgi:hypothetical protein